MPLFNYIAIDKEGKQKEGTLEVGSQNEAIARIKEINIIGNEAFSDSELLSEMSLSEESWHSAISQSGRYAKEELLADIENLRSFYLDRGFMNFQLLSSDVSISQNKQDIFISLALAEGERFSVGEIAVEGGGGCGGGGE